MSGGKLDARGLALLAGHVDDAEYRRRADLHRPAPIGLEAEAKRLLREGLSVRDAAAALQVHPSQVEEWGREVLR